MKRFRDYLKEIEEGSFDRIAKLQKDYPNSFSVVGDFTVKILEWVKRKGIQTPNTTSMKIFTGDRIEIKPGNKPGRKMIQFVTGGKAAFYVDEKVANKIERASK